MKSTQTLHPTPATLLLAVHSRIRGLLAGIDSPERGENPERSRQVRRLRQEVEILLDLERSVLYPALLNLTMELAIRVVGKARQDCSGIASLLGKLQESRGNIRLCNTAMDELRQSLLSHLEREETQVFPLAEILPLEKVQQLSLEIEELEGRLRTNPKQDAPSRRETRTFYPTLQDEHGAPEDDRDAPESFRSPGEANERHPSDFESWGSE